MSERFYSRGRADGFGALAVDVPSLFRDHPVDAKEPAAPRLSAGPSRVYRRRLLPLRHRIALASRLRRLALDADWYETFARYWVDVLGGRPLWGVEDFYFLRGWYRTQHQENVVPHTDVPSVHLEAWQRPELLYQVFHQVYVESRYVNSTLLRLLRDHRVRSLLEFGCATAPVTTHAFTFLDDSIVATIADIETVAFHYGAYKLRGYENVRVVPLRADDAFALSLDGRVDAITCLTVFEHLNQPLETVRAFHDHLAPGGLLLFDYAATQGAGLDTRQGMEERDAVLDFVEARFDLVHGSLRRDRAIPLAAARKRS